MMQKSMDLYVLDMLANDVEDVESILRMLNHSEIGWAEEWGHQFTSSEVVQALARLTKDGAVRAYVLNADGKALEPLEMSALPATFDGVWFGLTGRGRIRHSNWQEG